MERDNSRLYSGPLSQAAQKILAVLRAQNAHTARGSNSFSNSHGQLEMYYGSQREHQAQSSRGEAEGRDRHSDRPQESSMSYWDSSIQSQSSQTQAYYQYSQTPDDSQSSSSSLQSQSLQARARYQHSQTCSYRVSSQSTACQISEAPAFGHRDVSETTKSSHRDGYTLSLQTPETICLHQATPWRNPTEEIRASFILSQGSDEAFFPIKENQKTNREEPAIPSCFKITEATDNYPSVTQTGNWPQVNFNRNNSEDTVASDNESNGMLPLSNITEVSPAREEHDSMNKKSEPWAIKPGRIRLYPSGKRQETDYDTKLSDPLRWLGEMWGGRQMLAMENFTGAAGGQISVGEHGGLESKAIGHSDAALQKERGAANEIEVLLLGNNENTRCESDLHSLSATRTVDTHLDNETEGMKLDFEHRVNASEGEGLQNQLGSEDKEMSVRNQTDSPAKTLMSAERREIAWQAESPQDGGQTETEPGEKHHMEGPREQPGLAKLVLCDTTAENMGGATEERVEVMQVGLEVESGGPGNETSPEEEMETEKTGCRSEERWKDTNEQVTTSVDSEDANACTGGVGTGGCSTPTPQECETRGSDFRVSGLPKHSQLPANLQTGTGSTTGNSSNADLTPASSPTCGQHSSVKLDMASTSMSNPLPSRSHSASHQPQMIPSFPLKRKHEVPQLPTASRPPKITITRRHPKWEPPRSSREGARERGGDQKEMRPTTSNSEHPLSTTEQQAKALFLHKMETMSEVRSDPFTLRENQRQKQMEPALLGERGHGSTATNAYKHTESSNSKPPRQKRAKFGPDQATNRPKKSSREGADSGEPQTQTKTTNLTAALTSDPTVKDSGKLSKEEKVQVLEEAGRAEVLVLTMVYQDGTTQLDPEQKLSPPVCGLLLLMKNDLDCNTLEDTLGPNDSLVYLKLEHTPAWAQQQRHHKQEPFTRDMLLHILSSPQLVVCYKAKDLLRTALHFYRQDLDWKRVVGCGIQDPQVSGWLLDPADPSSCFQDLLTKHCGTPHRAPTLGTKRVISGLYSLYWLHMDLCSKLKSQGLWELYSHMELNMIPVLAVMESHRIHVDKLALKRTSDLLGTKMKQLEQQAHQAAGQIFLVTSNTQLRTVLFEKLRLHERCENRKLPKTINKQQQSTSEAALLQLQDLHPLPKIILEYRQVHKIKSTFVDGILSCMMSKSYISSTWHQTTVVTGRISAKHPNFQALPRQPLQITKTQYIQGKEEEVVTVHPRAMFIPQESWTFLAADFCQVELRLLAHLSSDPELLRIFTNPQADVFTMLASQWKGTGEGDVTPEDREHAKRIVYSVVYGAGRERLSGILGVSAERASRFQDSFLHTYKEVQTFIQRTIQQCHKQGYVLSIMGRRRTLPNINSSDWGIRMQAERQAVNFVVQGSAADLCKMAMIRIFNQVSSSSSLSARLIAQLHDELLYEVLDSQVEQFAALVRSTMESLQHVDHLGVHLKVPLKVAVSSGKSWGSMSELGVPSASPSPSI